MMTTICPKCDFTWDENEPMWADTETPISELEISIRVWNALRNDGIETIRQLRTRLMETRGGFSGLNGTPNIGPKSIVDIRRAIQVYDEQTASSRPA